MDGNPDQSAARVPVAEERLSVAKTLVRADTVTVRTRVHHEMATAETTLSEEEIEVRRVSVDRPVTEPPSVRQEGDTVIFPVVREELVVQTRLRLVEEVHVTTRKTTRRVTEQVPLRRTEAVVDRRSSAPDANGNETGDEAS